MAGITIDVARFVVSLIFAFSILELVFRVAVFPDWRAVGQSPFSSHPIYGTFQKPNSSIRRYNPPNYDVINKTNSLGFRDREEGFDTDLSGVWVVGASNSYGGSVENEELYTNRLQDLGYRVANLSSEGHRLADQVNVIKHLFFQGYRPTTIIAEVTLNNAFGDHERALQKLRQPLALSPFAGKSEQRRGTARQVLSRQFRRFKDQLDVSWISIKSRLLKNSAIYAWIKVEINSIPAMRTFFLKTGIRADVALADSTPIELQKRTVESKADSLVISTADYIQALQRWVEDEVDAKFGLIVIPSHHHLNPDYFERYAEHLNASLEQYDRTRSYNLFLAALQKRGVRVLGMAPALLQSGRFLSFPDDGHLNAVGHQIVAETLADWLKSGFGSKL